MTANAKFAAIEYLKININGRRVFVEVSRRKGNAIFGYRVTETGEKFERVVKDAVQIELIVFTEASVIGRYRLNLHYGQLEPA